MFIQENAFESAVCEMAANLSGPQCVNSPSTGFRHGCLQCMDKESYPKVFYIIIHCVCHVWTGDKSRFLIIQFQISKHHMCSCAHTCVCVSTYTHSSVVFFGWYENVGKWKRVLYYCPFVRVTAGTGGYPHKEQIIWMFLWCLPGGRFKNAYELLNLRALKIPILYKNRIFQCMSKIFCVEFQRVPLKFHTKYLTHTLKDVNFITRWNFKSS